MADVEIKRKVRLSRKEAGERLIVLGRALAGSSTAEVDFDGESIRFGVADDLEWEFELEVDGDEIELEIELKWSEAAPSKPESVADAAPEPAAEAGATPAPEADATPAPAPKAARKSAPRTPKNSRRGAAAS